MFTKIIRVFSVVKSSRFYYYATSTIRHVLLFWSVHNQSRSPSPSGVCTPFLGGRPSSRFLLVVTCDVYQLSAGRVTCQVKGFCFSRDHERYPSHYSSDRGLDCQYDRGESLQMSLSPTLSPSPGTSFPPSSFFGSAVSGCQRRYWIEFPQQFFPSIYLLPRVERSNYSASSISWKYAQEHYLETDRELGWQKIDYRCASSVNE